MAEILKLKEPCEADFKIGDRVRCSHVGTFGEDTWDGTIILQQISEGAGVVFDNGEDYIAEYKYMRKLS